jgi:signal transduction histidine kinase
VELVRKFAPDLPPVHADAAQLEQAFLNLTLNAVQAMPAGGRLTLTTRAAGKPAHVRIEFKDTGRGMSADRQKRAFSSLLSTTQPQGTGLGLAIVKRVVETHRGEVKIKSQVGKGTTITLTLPAA